MKVKELRNILSVMPHNAQVGIVYDGSDRLNLEAVWLARSGRILVSAGYEPVYNTDDRPHIAPTQQEERYWEPLRWKREKE